MYHLGLTGNIASGKSTVARMLVDRGAVLIDSDILAREAVAKGSVGLSAVIDRFGDAVLAPDGSLDRKALGRRVFNDPVARDALNQIIHPIVGRLREQALVDARARGERVVVSDIPLLFEVGLEHEFDAVLFVDASDDIRLARLVHDRHLPEADARAMMAAQWPAEKKRSRSTFVIENSGSLEALTVHVDDIWRSILNSSLSIAATRPTANPS